MHLEHFPAILAGLAALVTAMAGAVAAWRRVPPVPAGARPVVVEAGDDQGAVYDGLEAVSKRPAGSSATH